MVYAKHDDKRHEDSYHKSNPNDRKEDDLETVICDLGMEYFDWGKRTPCKKFDLNFSEIKRCEINQYIKCRKLYKESKPYK